jgi:hypothetical protein
VVLCGLLIDVAEGKALLHAKGLRMVRQVGMQLVLGGLKLGSEVTREKLHLLPQATANDGVVAIQPQGNGLTVEDFLADVVLDEPFQLCGRGRTLPGAREADGEVCNLTRCNDDLPWLCATFLVHQAEDYKQHGTQ